MTNKGFVLPLTLMIIAFSVAMLTTVMRRAFVFQDKTHFALLREQARTLALGGIQVGLAQLSLVEKKEKNDSKESQVKAEKNETTKDQGQDQNKIKHLQDWLKKVMLIINKWQNFELKKNIDNIDAFLQIYISCEQGKINLNKLIIDPKLNLQQSNEASKDQNSQLAHNEQDKQIKNYIQSLEEKFLQTFGISIVNEIKEIRKRIGGPLQDPTQLISPTISKAFKNNIFIMPEAKAKFFLTDLFTVETKTEKLNPWLISSSLCALLGLQLPSNMQFEGLEKKVESAVKNLRPYIGWKKDWDTIMEPLYGKPFASIPQGIDVLFSPEFEATSFSIIVQAKIENVIQRVAAIVEKTTDSDNISSKSMIFKIKKLYWL